jgi:cellulose biosynthesis protein BcsQ
VISSVCAADVILVPTAYDAFSLRGVSLTLEEATCIRETFGLGPVAIKILPTMVDRRLTLSRQAPATLQQQYPENVLPLHVRTTAAFTKALHAGETIFSRRQRNPGREDYSAIAAHLLGITDWMERQEDEADVLDRKDATCQT